jgi:bacillithiol system protein YtxJ
MNWIPLTSEEQLSQILERSASIPQVIFKHSRACAVSSMVLSRLERSDIPETIDFYFLDLLRYRDISNKVARDFHVHHESPQVLLIKNGECIYDESHMGINVDDITEQASHN